MKYVCIVDYYNNCRTCDPGSSSKPFFFNDITELLDKIKWGLSEYSYNCVYSCETGKEINDLIITYHCSMHTVKDVTVKAFGETYKLGTADRTNLDWNKV